MFEHMTHLNLGVAKWVSHQPTIFWQVEMLFEPTVTGGGGGLNLKKWKKKSFLKIFNFFYRFRWVNPLLACQSAFLYFFFFLFFWIWRTSPLLARWQGGVYFCTLFLKTGRTRLLWRPYLYRRKKIIWHIYKIFSI